MVYDNSRFHTVHIKTYKTESTPFSFPGRTVSHIRFNIETQELCREGILCVSSAEHDKE